LGGFVGVNVKEADKVSAVLPIGVSQICFHNQILAQNRDKSNISLDRECRRTDNRVQRKKIREQSTDNREQSEENPLTLFTDHCYLFTEFTLCTDHCYLNWLCSLLTVICIGGGVF
jgi:hypothetical protein